jgi:hypothetical protein
MKSWTTFPTAVAVPPGRFSSPVRSTPSMILLTWPATSPLPLMTSSASTGRRAPTVFRSASPTALSDARLPFTHASAVFFTPPRNVRASLAFLTASGRPSGLCPRSPALLAAVLLGEKMCSSIAFSTFPSPP